jgi:hypothetical protein
MLTVLLILSVAALIAAILTLMGRCPVAVPVLLLAIIEVLEHLPLGR